jgi:hypothetical protein
VRSAAAQRLIELHGLGAYNQSYQDRLGPLQNRLSSPLASVRKDALAELNEIFARSEAGEAPETLGLTWRADETKEPLRSFAESLRSDAPPWQQDFALDGLSSLTGYTRRWVEDCLWHFLPTEPRAALALALAYLDGPRAVEPLREALPLAAGATAAEIQTALSKLVTK